MVICSSLQYCMKTTVALNCSPQRCLVFEVVTLELDACQKLLLPVSLPVHVSDKGIQISPRICENLDNQKQASSAPRILSKIDYLVNKQMLHISDCRSSAMAFVVSSSARGNSTRQMQKKNKQCNIIKSFSVLSLQNSPLQNFSSCFICDGSNLAHNAVTNRNLVSKPVKKNLKKTKKKEKENKKLVHCENSVVPGNTSGESICESSVTSIPSSPEATSQDITYVVPISNSLVAKRSPTEKTGINGRDSTVVKPHMHYLRHIPSTGQLHVSGPVDASAGAFARGELDWNQNKDECLTAEETSERGIFSSSRDAYVNIHEDLPLYSSSDNNNAKTLDAVLDNGSGANTACDTVNVESHLFIEKGGWCECATDCNSLLDIGSQCLNSNLCGTKKKTTDCQTSDPCGSDDSTLTRNIDDQTCCGSEACSSTSIISSTAKRGRNNRKVMGKDDAVHKFDNSNTYVRTKRVMSHSVWQRVQKDSCQEIACALRYPNSFSLQHHTVTKSTETRVESGTYLKSRQRGKDETLGGDPVSTKMLKSIADANMQSAKSTGKLVSKMPEKLKTKSLLVPKQGPKEGSQDSNNLAHLVKKKKSYGVGSCSVHDTSTESANVHPTQKPSSFQSKPWLEENVHANEISSTLNVNDFSKKTGFYAAQNDISLSVKTRAPLDMKCMAESSCNFTMFKLDEDAHSNFCHMNDDRSTGRKPETGGSHAEYNKQDTNNNPPPVLQKWVPVGKRHENKSKSKNILSESVICFSPELDGMTDKSMYNPHHIQVARISPDACSTQEARDGGTYCFETELNKIYLAAKEAYKLQIASENFQLANGNSLAEFERLLHSASPVLGQMLGIPRCKHCSQDQLIGDTLCQHQVPNITLRSLWQWYEKPGNYGLEVKVEDNLNSKILGSSMLDFRAYFVPYLSAVQLFGQSTRCTCGDNSFSDGKFKKMHEADGKTEKSSKVISFPMFSLLVPSPRKETVIQIPNPSVRKDDACNDAVCKKCLMAQELLFEYFECDQPQNRQPLFEKIKEMSNGNSISSSQSFGDPLRLDCSKLHDLHPASWFSVAWYPIYRIPDGRFRAAFLTYHCLGYFTHRNASVKSVDGVSHISSPVVGLQSYNAKGECWFQPRGLSNAVAQTEWFSNQMPSEILKERLRTLETTASAMSRASVTKGGQTSVNRQPDYEFFLCRST